MPRMPQLLCKMQILDGGPGVNMSSRQQLRHFGAFCESAATDPGLLFTNIPGETEYKHKVKVGSGMKIQVGIIFHTFTDHKTFVHKLQFSACNHYLF